VLGGFLSSCAMMEAQQAKASRAAPEIEFRQRHKSECLSNPIQHNKIYVVGLAGI